MWLVVRWLPQLAGKLHVPRPPPRRLFASLGVCVPWMCVSVVKLSFVCLPTWKTLGFVKFMQMSFRQLAINVCTGHSTSLFPIFVCVLVHPSGCLECMLWPFVAHLWYKSCGQRLLRAPRCLCLGHFEKTTHQEGRNLPIGVYCGQCANYIIFLPAYWGLELYIYSIDLGKYCVSFK